MKDKPLEKAFISRSTAIKLSVLTVAVMLFVVGLWFYGDVLSLEYFAQRESELREYQQSHPVLVFGAAFLFYVAVTGLSLPGAAALSLLYGWYFGLANGVVLLSFASTTGATVAFLLSRFLFRDLVMSKFGHRLHSFNENLERDGAFYLFSLRLIPAVPFFVINLVMGLTPMRVWTFWWVSQLGMLAGTIVFAYAGASFPSLGELAENGVGRVFNTQIIVAFVLLGMFPLIVKEFMNFWRRSA